MMARPYPDEIGWTNDHQDFRDWLISELREAGCEIRTLSPEGMAQVTVEHMVRQGWDVWLRPEPAADEPAAPAAVPAVSWDDLAVGQVIRFWYHNRSQRLAGRAAKSYLARIRHIWRPETHVNPQVGLEVLKADRTRNHTIGFYTLQCGPKYPGLAEIIEIVDGGPAPVVKPQDLTAV